MKFVWNIAEIRKDFSKIVSAAIFCDAGNVWSEMGQFDLNGLRFSYGAGIRIFTPIGALRGDYAFKIESRPGESEGELHFGTGLTF